VSESGLNKTEVRLGLAAFGAIAVVGFATQLLLPALPVPITVGAATGSLLIVFRRWKNTLFRDLHAPVVGLRAELPGIRGEVEETRALVALQEPRFGIPLPWSNWALPPRGLLEVLKTVQELESPTIVDCGSGVSTLHLARAVRELGKGRVIALEQDADWADYIRRMLERHDLASWATLVVAPVEPCTICDRQTAWYTLPADAIPAGQRVDLVVVDGPRGRDGELSRLGARHEQVLAARRMSCLMCGGSMRVILREMFDDRYGHPGLFDVAECASCGFMSTEPRLSDQDLPELYSTYYPRRRATAEGVRRGVEEMAVATPSGCGIGSERLGDGPVV